MLISWVIKKYKPNLTFLTYHIKWPKLRGDHLSKLQLSFMTLDNISCQSTPVRNVSYPKLDLDDLIYQAYAFGLNQGHKSSKLDA